LFLIISFNDLNLYAKKYLNVDLFWPLNHFTDQEKQEQTIHYTRQKEVTVLGAPLSIRGKDRLATLLCEYHILINATAGVRIGTVDCQNKSVEYMVKCFQVERRSRKKTNLLRLQLQVVTQGFLTENAQQRKCSN